MIVGWEPSRTPKYQSLSPPADSNCVRNCSLSARLIPRWLEIPRSPSPDNIGPSERSSAASGLSQSSDPIFHAAAHRRTELARTPKATEECRSAECEAPPVRHGDDLTADVVHTVHRLGLR